MQNQPIINDIASQALTGAEIDANIEWWRGAVIYQIYPRSFFDSNNDGIGDLPGILKKLDYVASLGVDGIWLSPFFTSPMADFGYDVSDYRDVDPIFGTMADFDRIIEKCHALGLKVVIDQVYSHTSNRHPWYRESKQSSNNPKSDWYVWADAKPDGSPPNNWLSVFGGSAWSWDTKREQYYFHNFLSAQPDLNMHNPEVQEAIFDTARFWLDRGVDGFRLDALNFLMHDPELRDNPTIAKPKSSAPFDCQDHIYNKSHPAILGFLEKLRAVIDEYPDRFTVAEIGGEYSLQEMQSYTRANSRVNTAYGFQFLEADALSAKVIRDAIEPWNSDIGLDGWPSWAFSNHDRPRAISRWGGKGHETQFAKMLVTLVSTLRGSVFMYQGEELGLPQSKVPYELLVDPEGINNWPNHLDRDGTRTPMPWQSKAVNAGFSGEKPWLPVDGRHGALAVDEQDADPESVLNYTRRFLILRRGLEPLKTGEIDFLDTPEPVLAFVRRSETSALLCVFNLSAEAQPTPLSPKGSTVWRCGADPSAETLPPYGAYILELQ